MPDTILSETKTDLTADLATKEALALPKKGDLNTSSLTIREPEGLTKGQFDENLTKTFENGASILENAYEKLIKSNPDRASVAANFEQSLSQLALQGDAAALANLKPQLESVKALAESDSALKAFHDTLIAILSLDQIDEKTKFGAAQNIMQEFAFIKNPAENKEREVENIGAAFVNLAKNQIFNENSIAEALKINHDKFLSPLQEEVKNIALQISEEQKTAKQINDPATTDPITNSSSNTNTATAKGNKNPTQKNPTQKEKEQETEANSGDKAAGAALVGSAKYIAVGGAAITVTAFFPPIGAALLIGAALFCAYQSMKKPIKDYQPMTDKEAEIDPEATRIAQMSSEEFMKYQAQKRDLENSNQANHSAGLNSRQSEIFKQETLAVENQLQNAQTKLDQANAIANGTAIGMEAKKLVNEASPLSQLLKQDPLQSEKTALGQDPLQSEKTALGQDQAPIVAPLSTPPVDNIFAALGGQANGGTGIGVNGGSGASVASSDTLNFGLNDTPTITSKAPVAAETQVVNTATNTVTPETMEKEKEKENGQQKTALQNIAEAITSTTQDNSSDKWRHTIQQEKENQSLEGQGQSHY